MVACGWLRLSSNLSTGDSFRDIMSPPSDEKDDLALALRLSQLSDDDFGKEIPHLHSKRHPPTGEAHPMMPPVEDNDLEPSLAVFQRSADGFNQRKEGRPSMEGSLALSHTAISPSEVRTRDNSHASANRGLIGLGWHPKSLAWTPSGGI